MRLCCLTTPTPESISHAKRLGLDAVEFCIGWCDSAKMAQAENNLEALRHALHHEKMAVCALAVHGNTLLTPAHEAISWFKRAIDLAVALRCDVVTSTTGRVDALSVEENLPLLRERYEPACERAEASAIRIAVETWPGRLGGHGPYGWAGIAYTPELWEQVFDIIPSPALSLVYDPSHLIWQEIDCFQALDNWHPRVHHLRANDLVIHEDRLRHVGVHGLGWWEHVLPGLGQVDWPRLFSQLQRVGYSGALTLGTRDARYAGERRDDGLRLGVKALRPLAEAYR